jgi:hypothetical protein
MTTMITSVPRSSLHRQINPASRCFIGMLLASVLLLASLSRSRADTPALTATGGTDITGRDATQGWVFTLSLPLLVTSLGVYDGPSGASGTIGDGLAAPHKISIWLNGTTTALASATVPTGTATTLDGAFRYVSITPTLLPVGTYIIGGYYPDTPFALDVVKQGATFSTGPAITYTDSASAGEDGVPPPANFPGRAGFFGPNFEFLSVPEGHTSALLLLGAGVFFAMRAYNRRRDGADA